jgi:hypothetical protein
MASGSYVTSSDNSRTRVRAALIVGAEWVIAMGDDSVEDHGKEVDPEILKQDYARLGFKITDVTPPENGTFEFCSHLFTETCAIPLNFAKGVFRFLSKKITTNDLEQFKAEYRYSPNLPGFLGVLARVRPQVFRGAE